MWGTDMTNTTISIITPCLNAVATLGRTIASVAAQTTRPLEYIIIDGGSTDGSLELARNHPAVTRVVSGKDTGIADAFNKGIRMARGDVIGIINADDWYEPETIEYCTAIMQDESIGVSHGVLRYWNGDKPYAIFYPNQESLLKEMTINHQTMFVRRNIYKTQGFYDLNYKYAMDYELALRLFVAGVRFHTVNTVFANMSLGGTSQRHWIAAYIESARAKSRILNKPIASWLYCLWQIMRTTTRRMLLRMGQERLVDTWRKKISVMCKDSL